MKIKNNANNPSNPFPHIISWHREPTEDQKILLMNRFPQAGDNIKKVKSFNVKDHERALFLKHGELITDLGGGTYDLEKSARIEGTEIIWFDTSIHQILWGIPQTNGIPTQDGFIVGLFGDLKLHIENATIFYRFVVGGKPKWAVHHLKEWIKGLFHTTMRDIFKNYDITDILRENREVVMNKVIAKVCEELNLYGLELDAFNILGFKPPESAKHILGAEKATSNSLQQWINTQKAQDLEEHQIVRNRIVSLKKRLQDLQDRLIAAYITQDEYNEKSELINTFITEAKAELRSE